MSLDLSTLPLDTAGTGKRIKCESRYSWPIGDPGFGKLASYRMIEVSSWLEIQVASGWEAIGT